MAMYIDRVEFNSQLVDYLEECNRLEAEGKPINSVPELIGAQFLKIANGLARSRRWSSYTYIDEMIGDGLIACTAKIRNYDHHRYNNPFAYFTQICWFEFLGRSAEEYHQKKIIYRVCEKMSLEDFKLDADDVDNTNQYLEFVRENIDQRELDRIRDSEKEKKFVHRMITKKQPTPKKQVVTPNMITFD